VRNRTTNKSIVVVMAVVLLLSITVMMSLSQAPAAAGGQGGGGRGGRGGGGAGAGAGAPAAGAPAVGGGAGGGGGRGGGGGAAPDGPTPRLPDGTVNLGRAPGESVGTWNLPYITNMGAANVVVGAQPAGAGGGGGRGGGGAGGGRGGGAAAGAPAAGGAAGANAGGGRGGGGGGNAGAGGRGGGNPVPALRGSAAQPWVPFLPWAAAFYDYNQANAMKYDPEGMCLPPGGPRMFATPYPAEFIQSPETKRIWIVFEGGAHVWREIYMDGRPHPKNDSIKGLTWLGHSVGKWEGDTLVVDVTNFNEGTWLDYAGHPHTDQMHVVERFTRPTKNTLHYEALIDDPGAYTKPWTVQWNISWDTTSDKKELKEYICQENNLYLNHLKDDFGNSFIPH